MSTEAIVVWRKFLCRACGLIYDEALGDPDSGIAPGTRFEDIPEDWECPLCGVVKADFEPYDDAIHDDAIHDDAIADHAASASASHASTPGSPSAKRRTGIVVVGAGIAGWSAVEALRQIDAAVPITLVTACGGDRYHKPELSVAVGRRLDAGQLVRETACDAARRLNVTLMTETFVVGLISGAHTTRPTLRTTRGPIGYTKLILALGARPAMPDALSRALCWRVNDLATWAGLRDRLSAPARRVAIVGAGMIGCELAEDFSRAGHRVTLIDMHAYPLATLVPAIVGSRLQSHLTSIGVHYLPHTTVAGTTRSSGQAKRLTFADGACLEVDEIVAATGLVTDPRIARLGRLAFDRGIVVDPVTLQTSDPAIYALGDCISIDGAACRFVEPIAKQAASLAHHALGRSHDGYRHTPPLIRLKTKGFPLVINGAPHRDIAWTVIQDDDKRLVIEQQREGHRLAGLEVNYRIEKRAA